jgi:hypothetical protein
MQKTGGVTEAHESRRLKKLTSNTGTFMPQHQEPEEAYKERKSVTYSHDSPKYKSL